MAPVKACHARGHVTSPSGQDVVRHPETVVDEGDGLHLDLVGAVDAESHEHGVGESVVDHLGVIVAHDLLGHDDVVAVGGDGHLVVLTRRLDDVRHNRSFFSQCGRQII